jgi:hypothetical protein
LIQERAMPTPTPHADASAASDADIADLARDGLYDPRNEHDACGVGFVAHIKGAKAHAIVQQGLKILENLDHRGAVGADELMGDGAGILIQIPDDFYRAEMAAQGVTLPPPGEYGVGMIFLPKEHASRLACEQELERAVKAEGQVLLGWRDVPVDLSMPMSPAVRAKEPVIRQIFIGRAGAQALRHPQDGQRRHPGAEAHAQPRVLRAQHELPHRHLQGPAAGQPGGRVLQGPGRPPRRQRAGARPPALLHQHLPGMAAGTPLPHGGAQRRDQHRQGQLQLDARP